MSVEPFELAIIGGGIVGAMAAYVANQRRPRMRILLVDRSLFGRGATQYSAGLDFPYGRTPFQKHLTSESIRAYRDLKSELPELPIYEVPLYGVVRKGQVEETLARFTDGDIHPASGDEYSKLRQAHPDFLLSEEQVLLSGCAARYGFPDQIASALVDRLRGGRVECWEGVEIRRIEAGRRQLSLVAADGRTIPALRALVATGPWILSGPGEEFARSEGVRIKKVAAMHIDQRPEPHAPMLYFFDEDAFLLPLHERGHWLFSFTSQEWDCVPEISRLSISDEDRALALSTLRRYRPGMAALCNSGRVFCDAYSKDRAPVIARVPNVPDLVVAGACSGAGYRLAPAIAQEALSLFPEFAN